MSDLPTEAWIQKRPHYGQSRAWRATERFVNLACGRGSGKTMLARERVCRFLPVNKPWFRPMYFYAMPTYRQAKRVAWAELEALIPREWLKGDPHVSEMYFETIWGSQLHVFGMDKPQRIEGSQWDGGVIDESSDIKPGTFARSVVPALEHRNAWCWRIGVPKRYGIGATEFKAFYDSGVPGQPGYDPNILSLSWPSSDILSPEQLEWARTNLDERDYNEQYGASWEDVGGRIHYAFDDVLNVSNQIGYDKDKPLVVSSDFNVDPMCWVIGHRTPTTLHVFDEIYLRNANTEMTLDKLYERYEDHQGGYEFYGDATGSARKTSASKSDYLQIRGDKRFVGARVYYPKANPPLKDRFASCNRLFRNAEGERNCLIHPRCEHLTKDLKERVYKEGTSEPDDYGNVGHMSDAFGYVVFRRFKIKSIPHEPPRISIG